MNEGRLFELGRKFNASLRKDDALEMDRGFGSGKGRRRKGWGSEQEPSASPAGMAWSSLISGKDFKALQRKPVKMCQSLEVSVA